MADSFRYAGYTLSFVKTVGFEDTPELDPSGTERTANRYEITVQGVIAYGINPSTTGETPAETLKRIKEDLMAPRQELFYAQNGKTILHVADPPDAANGPFPEYFRTILVSPGSLTVEFKVSCRTSDCALGKSRGWLSHRWEQEETFDKLGYSSVRTTGLLICRSDVGAASPDDFRGLVVPKIRNGYQREDAKYTVTPDGLKLAYSFTDKEYYLPPPMEGLEWDGEFTVMAVNGVVKGSCTVSVKGGKTADKLMLRQRANLIALSRILPLTPDRKNGVPINQVGFRENLNGAEIEVSYKVDLDARKVPAAAGQLNAGNQTFMIGAALIGLPIPGCPFTDQPGIAPPIRGNHPLVRLVHAVFHDPCSLTTELSTNGPITGRSSPGQPLVGPTNPIPPSLGNPASITVAPLPSTFPGPTPPSFTGGSYRRYSISSAYLWRGNTTSLTPTDSDKKRAFVDLGPAELDLEVTWTAERTGAPPELPDWCPPTDACPNFKLLAKVIMSDRPEVGPTGDLTYSVTGCYIYGVVDPTKVDLVAPLPPFLVGPTKQAPFTVTKDPIWKFLSVPKTTYWDRCCESGAAPLGTAELKGGPGIFGVPGQGDPFFGIPPGWLPPREIIGGPIGGFLGGILQGGGVGPPFPGG